MIINNFKIIIFFLFLFFSASILAMPEENELIENKAIAEYYSEKEGRIIIVESNVVITTISAVPDFLLSPLNIEKNILESDLVLFNHIIKNTGNTEINPFLNIYNKNNDNFDLINLEMYVDENENGIIDQNDIKINNGSTVNLKYKEEKKIIIKGYSPTIITNPNEYSEVELIAELPAFNLSKKVIDKAVFLSGPFINIIAQVDKNEIYNNESVSVEFIAENIGSSEAKNTELYINGVLEKYVYVEFEIPKDMIYEDVKFNNDFYVKYNGDSIYSFNDFDVNRKNEISSVIFIYDELDVNNTINNGVIIKAKQKTEDSFLVDFKINYKESTEKKNVVSNEEEIIIKNNNKGEIYFLNKELTKRIKETDENSVIGLEIDSAYCNFDKEKIEEIYVVLRTRNLKDEEENIKLVETGVNTGVFSFNNLNIKKDERAFYNNNILEVTKNDIIYVEKECNNILLKNRINVNPISVLFNSENNNPVAGILISLYKTNTLKSMSLNENQNDELIYEEITNEDGEFKLPELYSGNYYITVNVENTIYKFPSEKDIFELDEKRFLEKDASYGNIFVVDEKSKLISFDVPIDNKENAGLFVSKKANKELFEIGDIVEYEVKVYNKTGLFLEDLIFEDVLPRGISIYKNEFYINNEKYNFIKNKNKINAKIDNIKIEEELIIKYKTEINSDIYNGDKKNVAYIYNENVNSNKAVEKIYVSDSIINDEGIIFGKVYMDCNKNRNQEREELGIPNVKIYLDTGHYIETDIEGKFNFKTKSARTYVLSVDKSTLPREHNFHKTKSKNNDDPYSIFVDLKEGDFYKVNFVEGNCEIDYLKEVIERKNKILNLKDIHGLRFYDNSSKYKNLIEKNREDYISFENTNFKVDEDKFILNQVDVNLEEIIKNENNKLGFLIIKNNDKLPLKQQTIRIKGKIGSNFILKVNDKEISNERVGKKIIYKEKGIEAWEYIAVKLDVGKNKIELSQLDPFGNIRDKKEINVFAPGDPSSFVIEIPKEKIEANGYSEMPITIKIVDKNGIKINSKTPITIYSNFSKWKVYDEDDEKAGIQTFIVNGEKNINIIAPENFQEDVITVESGVIKTEAFINYKPNMKELVVAGIVSLQYGDEINRWEKDDKNHVSLFMQGKIKGNSLLTLNYDNKFEKELKGKIDPEEFYEIYGDASDLNFEGETYKKIYLKLEKEGRYVLYGKFTPKFIENNNKIATYERNMPGIEGYYNINNFKIKPFLGVSGDKIIRKEIRAKGISGPYNLLPSINENINWTIYLIEKDNSNNIISKEEQFLNKDYIVNENGFVYFNRPIINNENNIYIQSEYFEVNGNNPYFTKGFISEYKSGDQKIYTQVINEEENNNKIIGFSYDKKYKKSKVEIEYSKTIENDNKNGNASRLKYEYNGDKNKIKLESSVASEDFNNNYSLIKNNSKSLKVESFHSLDNTNYKIKNKAEYQVDNSVNQRVKGISSGIYKPINKNLNIELNLKRVERKGEESESEFNIINNVVSYNPNFLPKSQWDLINDIELTNFKKSSELKSEYFLKERSKIYLKHKIIDEFDSSFDISSSDIKTSLGITYETPKEGNIYSEIRLRDNEGIDELIYAFGANQGVKLSTKSKVLMGYEREENLDNKEFSNNFYLGYEYKTNTTDIYKAKIEYSETSSDEIRGFNFSAINRLSENYFSFNRFKYENIKTNNYDHYDYETNYIYRPIDSDKLNWMLGYQYTKNKEDILNKENYIKSYLNYDINTNSQYLAHIGYKNKTKNDYSGVWVTNRFLYDLNEKTDLSFRLGVLKDKTSQYMIGIESGRQFINNAWISLGYNFKYIKNDNYYNYDNANQKIYLKLRIKLDDSLFFWIK